MKNLILFIFSLLSVSAFAQIEQMNSENAFNVMSEKSTQCITENGDVSSANEMKLTFIIRNTRNNGDLEDQRSIWWSTCAKIFVYPSESSFKKFYLESGKLDSLFSSIHKNNPELMKKLKYYNDLIQKEIEEYFVVCREFNIMSKKAAKLHGYDYFGTEYAPATEKVKQ